MEGTLKAWDLNKKPSTGSAKEDQDEDGEDTGKIEWNQMDVDD